MRHLAIYGLPWPTRASSQRQTFIPTPREDSSVVESSNRRVSQKALPTLLSKLEVAAAASASTSSIPRRRALSEERPTKRRKTEPSARGESCDNNANGSPASGQTRSGRTSLPSAKAQEGDKRKRGRPRLSSPRRQVLAAEKPMKLKSLAVLCQPRDTNGRFGKKAETNGLFMRKRHGSGGTAQRQALRDLARGVGRESSVDDDSFSTTRGGDDEESDFLHKRSRRESSPFSTGYSEFHRLPRHILPASLEAGFQATGLSFMPNPMVFARRKWAFQISSAHPNGTADDECAPTANTTSPNSEDPLSISGSPHHANAEALKSFRRSRDESRDIGHHGDITLSMGALTHKPSPASFARRRWLKCALDCDVRKPSHADRTTTSGAIGYDRFPERLISPEPVCRSGRTLTLVVLSRFDCPVGSFPTFSSRSWFG
jgi:histone-lysine N-methyltransferase SUV420H